MAAEESHSEGDVTSLLIRPSAPSELRRAAGTRTWRMHVARLPFLRAANPTGLVVVRSSISPQFEEVQKKQNKHVFILILHARLTVLA